MKKVLLMNYSPYVSPTGVNSVNTVEDGTASGHSKALGAGNSERPQHPLSSSSSGEGRTWTTSQPQEHTQTTSRRFPKTILLRFKRQEEWTELYNRFTVFRKEWQLKSILQVLEYIMDSSLAIPFMVKVPASFGGEKRFMQTLEFWFVSESRSNEFEAKWKVFRQKFSSYDATMSLTLAMDLILGIIPAHFLDLLPVSSGAGHEPTNPYLWQQSAYDLSCFSPPVNDTPLDMTARQTVVDLPSSSTNKPSDPRPPDVSKKCDTFQLPVTVTCSPTVFDLATAPVNSSQTLTRTDSTCCDKFTREEGETETSSRRKSIPRKRILSIEAPDVNTEEQPSYETAPSRGSDSGFLTDPETPARSSPRDSQDPLIQDFFLRDLSAVQYMARVIETHRRIHQCSKVLEVDDVTFKDSHVDFLLVCEQDHYYVVNLLYETVNGNRYVYA